VNKKALYKREYSFIIDSAKLKQELGWEPSLQFEEGLERTVRWYLDNERQRILLMNNGISFSGNW